MAGTITKLEVQKNNPERVNVFLNDEFAFGLNIMAAAQLKKGQALSDDEIALLQNDDLLLKAKDHAIRFLGNRPRSQSEIRQKLQQQQYPPIIIDTVLTYLQTQGYVDDLAFAQYWISNRTTFRPRSIMALRAELRSKGVAYEVIDEALTDFENRTAALLAVRQKLHSFRSPDPQTFRQKMLSFLARRGFDYETALAVIQQLAEELELDSESFDEDDTYIQE